MKRYLLAAAAALAFANPAQAATLIINTDGLLSGATGVIVNGVSYDVTFVDGTCVDLFSDCDSNSDFVLSDVIGAFNALKTQVLGGPRAFTRIAGCSDAEECDINIPYEMASTNSYAFGRLTLEWDEPINGSQFDTAGGYAGRIFDTSPFDSTTFGVFTLSAAVPEPGSWAMMIAGFGVIGAAMRRRTRLRYA